MTANLSSMALLPNPEEALNVCPNANEKLSTKQFNKKYCDLVAEEYEIKTEEDSASEEDIEDAGESIDLEAPSENEEEESDGCYTPGEYSYEDDEGSGSGGR
ncbi:hypothetical protein O181_038581 [Austropuccinia psidii MF-1]|uniref:Uncharacterized protein n=1 Tax=Austropuccinia psidii MF-1 TaxID=1389203 RepID=A0A9Q3HBS1_9BASI|nr:hypothetical protein [Austropuccinia psidii MF-1]